MIIGARWADLPETSARHNVHVAVSSLRTHLERILPGRGRQLLIRDGLSYVFAPKSESVTDLQKFQRRLAEATQSRHAGDRTTQAEALRAALDLYVDEVLPADGSAEWLLPARDRHRQSAAEASDLLARLELDRGHVAEAVHVAQRSVEIDPWRDASWRTLIEAHRAAGDPASAERAKRQ